MNWHEWWNRIAYIDFCFKKDNSDILIRVPRTYVYNLSCHKDNNGMGRLDNCEIDFTNTSSWEIIVNIDTKTINIGKGFNSDFYKNIFACCDCKYILTYYKWYRTCIGIFKTKPYIEIYRDNFCYHVKKKNVVKYKK